MLLPVLLVSTALRTATAGTLPLKRLLTLLVIAALALVALIAFRHQRLGRLGGYGVPSIDQALTRRTSGLAPFVVVLAVLALLRGGLTFVYRSTLFKVAYGLEYDLRTTIYEHLTTLSFPFYDRVQSGQLISRANSDIRSVQL